jgi:hypothetical protein
LSHRKPIVPVVMDASRIAIFEPLIVVASLVKARFVMKIRILFPSSSD